MSEITDKLPRIKLNAKGPSPHQALADALVDLVGYKALDKHVRENQLAFLLDSLDIQPYENVAVKNYMKSELEKKRIMRQSLPGRRSARATALAFQYGMSESVMQEMIDQQYRDGTQVEVWTWKKYDVAKYTQPIPISALETMVNVAKRAEDIKLKVDFHVHSLESVTLTADPFLSVRAGAGHEYYIAVWDEPTFVG